MVKPTRTARTTYFNARIDVRILAALTMLFKEQGLVSVASKAGVARKGLEVFDWLLTAEQEEVTTVLATLRKGYSSIDFSDSSSAFKYLLAQGINPDVTGLTLSAIAKQARLERGSSEEEDTDEPSPDDQAILNRLTFIKPKP